jgi:hypothetical protein
MKSKFRLAILSKLLRLMEGFLRCVSQLNFSRNIQADEHCSDPR